MDLASVDAAQLRWLDAELRRRRATADALVVELDADAALGQKPADNLRQAVTFRDGGSEIGISLAQSPQAAADRPLDPKERRREAPHCHPVHG